MATEFSGKLAAWSAPVLLRIHALPRWAFPIAMAALLLGGLLTPNHLLSGILLTALGLILAWLVALSWSLMAATARLMRVLTLVVVFGYAVQQFLR